MRSELLLVRNYIINKKIDGLARFVAHQPDFIAHPLILTAVVKELTLVHMMVMFKDIREPENCSILVRRMDMIGPEGRVIDKPFRTITRLTGNIVTAYFRHPFDLRSGEFIFQ